MARGRHRHRRHHRRHRAHHHRQRQRRRHHHHHHARRRVVGGNGQSSDVKLTWRHFGILLACCSIVAFIMGLILIAMIGSLTTGIILLCIGGVAFIVGVLCLVCSPKPPTEAHQELTQVSLLHITVAMAKKLSICTIKFNVTVGELNY